MNTRTANEKDGQRPFVTDIQELRRRAREHMEMGAVTSGYKADRETVIRILNEVLATEIVCVLRYTMNAIVATGLSSEPVKEEFDQHAKEERGHMREVAERILAESAGGGPRAPASRYTGGSPCRRYTAPQGAPNSSAEACSSRCARVGGSTSCSIARPIRRRVRSS